MKNRVLACLLLITTLIWGGAPALGQSGIDYKIAPHDMIVIDVLGERELTKELRVSATGTINYFLLGTLQVAGKTTSEVTDELTELLDRDYLVEPQVSVEVKEYRVREVFVNGAVFKPGAVVVTGDQPLDILGAIFRAGGLTTRANRNEIRFTRPGQRPINFKYDELTRQGQSERIRLLPGDVIDVGEKLF